MADAPRNFDEEYAFDKKEPVEFVLGGETFHARRVLHPSVFMNTRENENGVEAAVRIIAGALESEDRETFNAMVEDPDILISAEQIDKLAAWILEETSGRPTKSRPKSGNGVARTGSGSKEASSAADRTGSR